MGSGTGGEYLCSAHFTFCWARLVHGPTLRYSGNSAFNFCERSHGVSQVTVVDSWYRPATHHTVAQRMHQRRCVQVTAPALQRVPARKCRTRVPRNGVAAKYANNNIPPKSRNRSLPPRGRSSRHPQRTG